jgi:hypothetical protein
MPEVQPEKSPRKNHFIQHCRLILPRLLVTIGPIPVQRTFLQVCEAEEIEWKITHPIKVMFNIFAKELEEEIVFTFVFNCCAFPDLHKTLSGKANHCLVIEFVNNGSLLQHLNDYEKSSKYDTCSIVI